MQAYGSGFAAVYNSQWRVFVERMAPRIEELYSSTPAGRDKQPILDICCGAGHLARYFLERGYEVTGLDLSGDMLEHARANAGDYIGSGKAGFIQGDAADFRIDKRFGMVLSTYDSLNHLPDKNALQGCFECARKVCDGLFFFDINTRRGLQRWNSIFITDGDDDAYIIKRGVYDRTGDKAWLQITGFVESGDGLYQRFDETVYNTAFDMEWVKQALHEAGWKDVYFAGMQDLSKPIEDPESEGRIGVVAR